MNPPEWDWSSPVGRKLGQWLSPEGAHLLWLVGVKKEIKKEIKKRWRNEEKEVVSVADRPEWFE